jgi:hypothetical protein
MSAYNPPLFNNSVIQFNPTIYETGTISTASQSLTLLKTDNIQCLLPNDSVTLYTVDSGAVSLGTSSSSVTVNGVLNSVSSNITSVLTHDIDKQVGQTDINIGATASNVVLKSTNAIVNGKLKTNNIQCKTAGDLATLYTIGSGQVSLGTSSSSVTVNGLLNSGLANITSLLTSDIDVQPALTDINIGNTASNVVIKSTNAIVNGTLKTNNTQCKTAGDTVSLYTVGSGAVTLGTSSSTVSVNGVLNSGTANLTSILTHGIDIQVGQTDINIGATASTLNVGNNATNTTINGAVTLGTSGSSVTLNGNLKTNNIQCKTAGDLVSLYTVGSGQVTLGTGGQGVNVVGLLSTSLADITGIATSNIDVQTGQTAISIGTSATTVLIRPTNTQISGNLQANNIDKYTSNPISLYSTATGNITLGNSTAGSTTSLNSPITNITSLKTNTITQQSGTTVDIQELSLITAQLYPKTSQTLYLGNVNSPNIEIGSATTVNTFIKNSNGLIIGKNPSTYVPSTGLMTGEGVRFTNDTQTSLIDFHSTTLTGQQDYTGRIIVQNGTTVNSGTMSISSGSIAIEPVNNLTLGSSTTTTTYVKTSNVTVIGANPTSYTLNKLTGLGLVITTAGSGINFYSNNSAVSSGYSGRIQSDGGTASSNSGTLHIDSGNIDLYAPLGNIIVGSAGTTSVTIGNSTIANVKIQTSDRVVMGNSPSTYNTGTGVLTGAGCVVGTNGASGSYNAFIDLYSFAGTLQGNSARIISNSAGLTISNNVPSQPLTISSSGIINSTQVHKFSGGIAYGKGNLTSPSFTQTGGFGNGATTVPANSVVNYSATWAAMGLVNFGTAPSVICCNGTSSGLGQKLIISCYGATTTQVSFSLYNPSSTTTGSVAVSIQFIATGGY